MPSVKPLSVAIGRRRRVLVIRLGGPCTLVVCTCLKKLLDQCRRPDTRDVYFDLSDTESIDSTFIGAIVSCLKKADDPLSPGIHLLRPTLGVTKALGAMHVLHLFHCCDILPVRIARWEEFAAERIGQDEVADVVLEAHERLMEADDHNAEVFGPLVEQLRCYRRSHQHSGST